MGKKLAIEKLRSAELTKTTFQLTKEKLNALACVHWPHTNARSSVPHLLVERVGVDCSQSSFGCIDFIQLITACRELSTRVRLDGHRR